MWGSVELSPLTPYSNVYKFSLIRSGVKLMHMVVLIVVKYANVYLRKFPRSEIFWKNCQNDSFAHFSLFSQKNLWRGVGKIIPQLHAMWTLST